MPTDQLTVTVVARDYRIDHENRVTASWETHPDHGPEWRLGVHIQDQVVRELYERAGLKVSVRVKTEPEVEEWALQALQAVTAIALAVTASVAAAVAAVEETSAQ